MDNIHISYTGDFSIGVSWDPPYSLKGVPILGYNVTVTDADSGEHVYSDAPSDSDVQVPGAVLQACRDYLISVVANNEVGGGNSSSVNVYGYPGGKLL